MASARPATRSQVLTRQSFPAAPGTLILETLDQRVEAKLLQAAPDGVELAGAVLDERLGLGDEVVRLAQPGLAGVQAHDDLLDPALGALVAVGGGVGHLISASTASSVKRSRTAPAARAASAVVTRSPRPSSTSA